MGQIVCTDSILLGLGGIGSSVLEFCVAVYYLLLHTTSETCISTMSSLGTHRKSYVKDVFYFEKRTMYEWKYLFMNQGLLIHEEGITKEIQVLVTWCWMDTRKETCIQDM